VLPAVTVELMHYAPDGLGPLREGGADEIAEVVATGLAFTEDEVGDHTLGEGHVLHGRKVARAWAPWWVRQIAPKKWAIDR
jgi:hypothetical protein